MKFTTVIEIIKSGLEVIEILKEAKKILLGDKSEAKKQLAETIREIQKFYEAFGDEISSFQSISFDGETNHTEQRKKLIDLCNAGMVPRISEARGHCYNIKVIYETHLLTWFNKVFRSKNAQLINLKNLFENLTTFDEGMFKATDELSTYLIQKATEILSLVEKKKFKEANSMIWDSGKELTPLMQSINKILAELTKLKNEFSRS